MTKQGTANGDAGDETATETAAEVKPKARKKKVVAETVAVEAVTAEGTAEEAAIEPVAPVKKAAKKAVKAKKDKGRDLVVDEPGAVEVAAVLGEVDADSAASEEPAEAADSDKEVPVFKGPEPKLERLQKILAKAGISSRRKAEELILGGLVQINGKVVMELGTKADASRDHIRVDGKLLQGPERIRYFVLNKPKGYVTTVSDPENRPTVMQFFAGERERLYPVGRLDYLSEGLLLVTNDGELANKLTKASSGVEKTYLVKVAGQPTEDMLDALREGVVIEKGRPGTGSGRVRTAPAQIRQVRQGDNPWYEVIIIEGRNRELRKMFEEIGHHVEKIRRVGYGPLVLDLEPGKLRELEAEEVHALRLASEGKLKTRRRRGPAPAQLPTVAGKTVRYKKAGGKPEYEPRTRPQIRPEFQTESKAEFKPAFKNEIKAGFKREARPAFKPEFERGGKPRFKPAGDSGARPGVGPDVRPDFRPDFRPGSRPNAAGRPTTGTRGGFADKPRRVEPPVTEYVLPPRKPRPEFDANAPQPKGEFNPDYKPGFRTGGKPAGRPEFKSGKSFKPSGPRKEFGRPAAHLDDDDFVPGKKTPGFKIEPVVDKPRGGRQERPAAGGRPFAPRSSGPRSSAPRSGGYSAEGRTGGGYTTGAKSFRPEGGRPAGDRPAGGDRPFRPRPDRGDGPPSSGGKPFRSRPGSSCERPAFRERPSRPSSGQAGIERTGSGRSEFKPRSDFRPGVRSGSDRPAGRARPFEGGGDARREARPRKPGSFDGPKKFGGAKPASARPAGAKPFGAKKFDSPRPAPGGRNSVPSGKLGPDGQPRVKVRARDSFTGKNKGRPKPKPRSEE
jgi:23S rRNA pseudouridine2605 synthase